MTRRLPHAPPAPPPAPLPRFLPAGRSGGADDPRVAAAAEALSAARSSGFGMAAAKVELAEAEKMRDATSSAKALGGASGAARGAGGRLR